MFGPAGGIGRQPQSGRGQAVGRARLSWESEFLHTIVLTRERLRISRETRGFPVQGANSGIHCWEWRARCGALPQWRAEWRAHTGLQRHRLVPRPTSIPRAMAFAGSCPSGAQILLDVDLLRAPQCRRQCGGNRLIRSAPANCAGRGHLLTPVPHCERMPLGRRQKHAWIAGSVHQTGARR